MKNIAVSDNKRIAKNAIFLYVRMIVMMLISLFTSREILRILGVEDYGLYNVVAGVVVLFAFLNASMIRATQRFLSFYIGKGDDDDIRKIFSTCINVVIIISLFVILVSETLGLWFINTYLKFPEGREVSMNIVYQFSILTFLLNIIKIPYNSAIIAHEKMSFYAYTSILDAILKLLVVYVLLISTEDRLSFYAILIAIVSFIDLIIYILYCKYKFETCRYEKYWNKGTFKELFSFSGWSMVSGFSNLAAQQGGNILLNMFCGVAANAAFGIASQVGHSVLKLTTSFSTAFAPQITKLYAVNDLEKLYLLIFRSSLISYYLMLIFSIPLFFEIEFVLGLWLVNVPENAAGFCLLIIVFELIDAAQSPLIHLMYSTGRIRTYVLWLGFLTFLNVPISYFLLKNGLSLYLVLGMRAFINLVSAVIRVVHLKFMINFPVKNYLKEVIIKIVTTTSMLLFIAYMLYIVLHNCFIGNIAFMLIMVIISIGFILFVGFSRRDRNIVVSFIKSKLAK